MEQGECGNMTNFLPIKNSIINSNYIVSDIVSDTDNIPSEGGTGKTIYNTKKATVYYRYNGQWIELFNNATIKVKNHNFTNCKNCGAPLHGNICEYCGTEY